MYILGMYDQGSRSSTLAYAPAEQWLTLGMEFTLSLKSEISGIEGEEREQIWL